MVSLIFHAFHMLLNNKILKLSMCKKIQYTLALVHNVISKQRFYKSLFPKCIICSEPYAGK